MEPIAYAVDDLPKDCPIPGLVRLKLEGAKILFAHIRLQAGSVVAPHSHESEQVSYLLSGRLKWSFGTEGTSEFCTREIGGGHVVLLPANCRHGVEAIEDSLIVDILSPPAPMGVDSRPS